jgi:hypothetical protein
MYRGFFPVFSRCGSGAKVMRGASAVLFSFVTLDKLTVSCCCRTLVRSPSARLPMLELRKRRALLKMPCIQGIGSTLLVMIALLLGGVRLLRPCSYSQLGSVSLASYAPMPLNSFLNQCTLTTTTMMLMKPRLVMMGVMYTKTCWYIFRSLTSTLGAVTVR